MYFILTGCENITNNSNPYSEAIENKLMPEQLKATSRKFIKKNKTEVLKLFKIVYFIALENLPFTKFEALCKFFEYRILPKLRTI